MTEDSISTLYLEAVYVTLETDVIHRALTLFKDAILSSLCAPRNAIKTHSYGNNQLSGSLFMPLWSPYYSTGVQVVSCALSDDSVLSESTGLFNPVFCVSQWNLFWQKNQPIRLCLSNQVRPGREWFPFPLGDFNRLFEGLIGELYKIWHWNMFYFFKWHQSGP